MGDLDATSYLALPPSARQRRGALIAMFAVFATGAIVAPFTLLPLPRVDAFVPTVAALVVVTDFVTGVLLLGQAGLTRSRATMVLASGYLFCCVVVAVQTLTFPGAFSASGLLGASSQTAAWLYVPWHVAFPLSVVGYAWLKGRSGDVAQGSAPMPVVRVALVAVGLAVAISAAIIALGDALPALLTSERGFASRASAVCSVSLVASLAALGLLWARRSCVLDLWLLVTVSGAVTEAAIVTLIAPSRYTFAFYVARLLAMVVSSTVLVSLIAEVTNLQAKLIATVRSLQRERASKLMNLEAMIVSVGHEVKQPLAVITLRSSVVQHLLKTPGADQQKVEKNLDDVVRASQRISQVFDNLRALFRDPVESWETLDVNALVQTALRFLEGERDAHSIVTLTDLAEHLPAIRGHEGQLHEVLLNLMQNAIEAMATVNGRARKLSIATRLVSDQHVVISIEDSGAGIAPDRIARLFDAFVTTKKTGNGLGLGICRLIVDRHAGRLTVSSEVGQGSRFEVVLPTHAIAAATLGGARREPQGAAAGASLSP